MQKQFENKALLLVRLALLTSSLLCFASAVVLLAMTNADAVPGRDWGEVDMISPFMHLSPAGLQPLVATSLSLATGGLVELNTAYTVSLSCFASTGGCGYVSRVVYFGVWV